jgi:hypothetical protein
MDRLQIPLLPPSCSIWVKPRRFRHDAPHHAVIGWLPGVLT